MAYYCPKCNSLITSRRRGYCTNCQEPLPEKMLYTKEEIEAQDKVEKGLEESRKERQKTVDAKRKAKSDDAFFSPPIMFF